MTRDVHQQAREWIALTGTALTGKDGLSDARAVAVAGALAGVRLLP